MKDAAADISHVVTHTAPHVTRASQRVVFIDLLRFVAVVQMLQGHTIAALLAPAYRHGPWHSLWSAARGLTSVAFLFASGLAFYVTSARNYEARHRDARIWKRRSVRAVQLIALGYLLHLPIAMWLSEDLGARAMSLRGFVAVDVLQCIGVSLLGLQALSWILPTRAALATSCAVIGAALLAITPWSNTLAVHGAGAPLAAYVSARGGSLFPLLPWAAHMFLGVACAGMLDWQTRLPSVARLALAACVLVLLSQALAEYRPITDHLGRLGAVVLLCAGLAWLSRRIDAAPAFVQVLASRTLFLYVFHVLLVYGQGVGLADTMGRRLSPLPAVVAAGVVVAVSFGLALGYDRLSARRLAQVPAAG